MHVTGTSSLAPSTGFVAGGRTDLAALARQFAEDGRVRIPGILTADIATKLHGRLKSWAEWQLVTVLSGAHREFDSAGMDALDTVRRAQFDTLVHETARNGFQYLFDNCPLYDLARAGMLTDPVLKTAFDTVRSEAFLSLARAVTGHDEISFADAQATRFRPGHFLTAHDDDAHGKGRVAAYVLNLTPDWRPDFGGQLQFFNAHGDVAEAYVPRFNALSLFKVPADHAVSVVAPFAPGARYAITGWLRAGEETPAS